MYFFFSILFIGISFVTNERHFGRRFQDSSNSRSLDSDRIIFPNEDYNWNNVYRDNQARPRSTARPRNTARPRTSTVPAPGMATRQSACEDRCQITPQYNPVCGSNDMTYSNHARLLCAKRCGRNVDLAHYGVCTSSLVLLRT
ncbi:hypothetical protein RN001_005149 [Aquatica leii]|uniref:Kazal-like domain-containing protein n=1 Tax=Aquatica leii TaxID=1421715 RepID=A0AAN7P678_9COLE|nr:hypothetical protein RN001_005149 [Aquatica leii]